MIGKSRVIREEGPALVYPPTAVLDPGRRYRHELTRTWTGAPPRAWCMLNPSTADAFADDQVAQ